MERAGEKLKRLRERLKLTYRDVEEASQGIAARMGNAEFAIALSRLADIENKGTVPTIFRLYSLCAIYRLELSDVMGWYGAPVDKLPGEALRTPLAETHPILFSGDGHGQAPVLQENGLDLTKTTFLSRHVLGWGKLPLQLLSAMDCRRYRYGLIGVEDRSMYPVLQPGSLVLLDDRARIVKDGWTNEYDRPIYFFELRDGYICGWCDLVGDRLVIQSHPSSQRKPVVCQYPAEIDLVGQVVGVAMLLGSGKHRRGSDSAVPAKSPDR